MVEKSYVTVNIKNKIVILFIVLLFIVLNLYKNVFSRDTQALYNYVILSLW